MKLNPVNAHVGDALREAFAPAIAIPGATLGLLVPTDNLDAVIGTGFYYFVGYCLVSNVAFQFLSVPPPDQES